METNYVKTEKRFSEKTAKEIAAVFESIQTRTSLTPTAVVNHAKNPKSPLHRFFDWNDSTAAEKHRLEQARGLIQSVKIRIQADPDSAPRIVRAFVRISDSKNRSSYKPMLDVLSKKEWRAQLLSDAFEEMEIFERKYRELTELVEVFEAVAKSKRNASEEGGVDEAGPVCRG